MAPGKLYVGNLPPSCKEKELRELFSSFGKLEEVAMFSKEEGPGYAFIHYVNQDEADAALESLDSTEFHSYTIAVQISRTKGHGYGRGAGPPRPPGERGPRDRPYRPDYRDSESRYSSGRDTYRSHRGGRYDSPPPPRDYDRSYHGNRESRGGYRRSRDYGGGSGGGRYDDGYYDDYRYRSRSPPPPRDYYHRYEPEYERRSRGYRDDPPREGYTTRRRH